MLAASALEIRIARPEDAVAIASCFDECYAGTYPLDEFTDPARLARRVLDRRTTFAVAVCHDEVVAGVALEPTSEGTGEFGHGVVKPGHRGQNLFEALHYPLLEIARSGGLAAVFGHCVTSHTRSQRSMPALNARVAGLSLSAAPRTLRFAGLLDELSQRESFLDFAFLLAPRQAAVVHVLPAIEGAVRVAYAALGLECRVARARGVVAPLGFEERRNVELGTATLRFGAGAGQPAAALPVALERLESAGARTVYAEVPLSHAGGRPTTAELRALGFSFGGVFPGRAAGRDALLLQRPRDPLSSATVEIGVAEAEAMKEVVFHDLAEVRATSAVREEIAIP